MYQKFLFILLFPLIISGCETANLPTGPDIFALQSYSNRQNLGVTKANDIRESNHAGTIGGLSIKVDKELIGLTTNTLIYHLNSDLKVNVLQIKDVMAGEIEDMAAENNLNNILMADIVNLRVFSLDSLLDPVNIEFMLLVKVYDRRGKQIYNHHLEGKHSKWLGLYTSNERMGELIEKAVMDSVSNLLADRDFKDIFR